MSDIIFIKNEEDYLNYKKLKPVKFYSRQKVKFKCKSCGKECIKAFYYLDLNFLCGKCKNKQTCLNKYGVENPFQVFEYIEKANQTRLEKYGSYSFPKTKDFNKKRTQTCLEKYGVELVRIKEYDWDNFKIDIKEKIKKLIIGE